VPRTAIHACIIKPTYYQASIWGLINFPGKTCLLQSDTLRRYSPLRAFLTAQAQRTSQANFPAEPEERERHEAAYNNEIVVDKALRKYSKNLIIMNWI